MYGTYLRNHPTERTRALTYSDPPPEVHWRLRERRALGPSCSGATMQTIGDTLPAEDIIHIVPDRRDPVYHWLYVRGGYLLKFNIDTGAVLQAKSLPAAATIADLAAKK